LPHDRPTSLRLRLAQAGTGTRRAPSVNGNRAIKKGWLRHIFSENKSPRPDNSYGLSPAMAIGSTVIPGFLVSEALRRIGANQVAIIGALGPASAIVLGYPGLDEIMTPLQIVNAAFVLFGVIAASRRPK
jgi:drug/metabolite transporter (DMT)-like permease